MASQGELERCTGATPACLHGEASLVADRLGRVGQQHVAASERVSELLQFSKLVNHQALHAISTRAAVNILAQAVGADLVQQAGQPSPTHTLLAACLPAKSPCHTLWACK